MIHKSIVNHATSRKAVIERFNRCDGISQSHVHLDSRVLELYHLAIRANIFANFWVYEPGIGIKTFADVESRRKFIRKQFFFTSKTKLFDFELIFAVVARLGIF